MTDQTTSRAFLNELQRQSFRYFLDLWNPKNGLIPDTSEPGVPASIAGVGFALSCYPVGVEQGYFSREEALHRTTVTLDFFLKSEQSERAEASGYKGFYYHFLDMNSGKRTWNCELSFIDTGFLLAGVICAAEYFSRQGTDERKIREMASDILSRMDWEWALGGKIALSHGWIPESGYINYDWEGYSEALFLYTVALGAEKKPLPRKSFDAWTATYQWENIYDVDVLHAGPLFIHLFSHAWIDFRGIRDSFMQEKKSDYFENTRRAIQVQRSYCVRNPKGFVGYGKNCWGITADAGPGYGVREIEGEKRTFFGYAARGVPFGPDDGTIAPWVCLAATPFCPDAALAAAENFRKQHPHVLGKYGFRCSFNLSSDPPWCPDRYYAMDAGISIMMLENARSGLLWNLMKGSPIVRRGLQRAGFKGGWLSGIGAGK